MEYPSSVIISLTVKSAADALAFYQKAFGAEEVYRMDGPDGSVPHCEFKIGNTHIMMSDEDPAWNAMAMPEGSMSSSLFGIMSENCDADYDVAVQAGAKSLSPPTDYFWGMRSAMVVDPFGFRWNLGQKIEDVSPEEMARRAQEMYGD
ncbi:MAG: VOC family protein [Verrucomicrobiota bacterium]